MLHSLTKTFRAAFLILVLLHVYAASANDLPPECQESEIPAGSPLGYFHFEYVARKIVVGACIENQDGRTFGAKFILDTGSERTSINPTLVEFAHLKVLEDKRALATVTGVRVVPQVDLPDLMLGGRQIKHLTATVEPSLVHASELFSMNFGGVVGMDVLSRYVLSIDYPYRRVAFFEKLPHVSQSSEVARFPFEVLHGVMVVNSVLPNGSRVPLEFDTGFGIDADVMLYQDAVEGLKLLPPIYSLTLEGDPVEIRSGHIPWIDFGNIRIESPTVALNPSKVPKLFGERYTAGLLGPILFESYTVGIDFHNHVVTVIRTKPRPQQKSTFTSSKTEAY
jgi:hypothetical protein